MSARDRDTRGASYERRREAARNVGYADSDHAAKPHRRPWMTAVGRARSARGGAMDGGG